MEWLPLVFGRYFPCGADFFPGTPPGDTACYPYMDHDLAGFVNARKIKTMLHEDKRFRHIRVSVNPPRMGKDYNEKLLLVREQLQTSQHQRRPKEAAVSI